MDRTRENAIFPITQLLQILLLCVFTLKLFLGWFLRVGNRPDTVDSYRRCFVLLLFATRFGRVILFMPIFVCMFVSAYR